jgi:hypothetical protein
VTAAEVLHLVVSLGWRLVLLLIIVLAVSGGGDR